MGRPRQFGERVPTQLRVPVELYERLVDEAEDRDLPINTIACMCIERGLDALVPLDELLRVQD